MIDPHTQTTISSDALNQYLFDVNERFESYRDHVSLSEEDSAFNDLQDGVLDSIKSFSTEMFKIIQDLNRVAVLLSNENDIDKILRYILKKIIEITRTDALTLYLKDRSGKQLDFKYIYNATMNIHIGDDTRNIKWEPLPLFNSDGSGNTKSIAALCALTAKTIIIDDVYSNLKFDFAGAKSFDAQTGYTTQSMLVIPIKNHFNVLIGVLQLINKKEKDSIVQFNETDKILALSFASQAAIAIHRARQQRMLEYFHHKIMQGRNIEKLLSGHLLETGEEPEYEEVANLPEGVISAEEYMKDMHDALGEEFFEMEDIEAEWDYEHAKHVVNPQYSFSRLASLTGRYAKSMKLFTEFHALSLTVQEIAKSIARIPGTRDLETQKKLLSVLETFGDTVAQWRRTIFIDKNTHDIHYLDQSIKQLLEKLTVLLKPNP